MKKINFIFNKRNVSNTHFNTCFPTHSLWLIKIHMGPTKFCGSHINLVSPMWILTNQRECVEKCVLKCVLLAFLFSIIIPISRWPEVEWAINKGMLVQNIVRRWLVMRENDADDKLRHVLSFVLSNWLC